MNEVLINRIHQQKDIPYHLLLLADPSEDAIKYYLDKGFCYVAYLDKEIIGIYVLLPTRPFTIELINLAIEEKFQGLGYGKKLIQHSINTSKELGYKILDVGTGNSSIGPLALYQKCGFSISSINFDFFENFYSEPIFENGIKCSHMIRLTINL